MQTIVIKKMRSSVASLVFAGLSLFAFSSHLSHAQSNTPSSAAPFKLTDPIPVGPQVKVGTLPNGLTYYLQKNSKPEKRVELRLVVKAGSMLEGDDQQGLAHFMEHMAFNGSTHFKKHELISYLQSIGIKFGADLNAYTSFDETVYILPIPTDNRDNLKVGFDILADWAQGVTLNDADIDKERDIILEEARLGKGAADRINKILLPEVFNGSRYAQRLPIGKEDIIKNFPHEALKRFYKDWYRPDLMAVIVVGDIEAAEAEKMVKEHFSGLKNPKNERPRVYAQIPPRTGSSALVITDKENTGNAVLIRYPVRATHANQIIADYRADIVKRLVLNLLGQRIQELTQQSMPPFQGAFSSIAPIAPGYESFTTTAALGVNGVEPAIAAVVQENERARQLGFSADELERSKKNYLRSIENTFNERDKLPSANFAAEYARNFLMKETIPGIENEFFYVKEFLPTITLDEINQTARKIIPHTEDKLIVYLGSTNPAQVTPSKEQLLAAVSKAENQQVVAKKEEAVAASLMAVLPTPGKIITDTENSKLGTHELLLSNGVKVILKPTDFQNNQILMSARRFGGQSVYAEQDTYNARYANAVVGAMGLHTFSPTEVRKILAGRLISVGNHLDTYTEGFDASASSADLEQMLQVLDLRFASPRKDPALFQAFISNSEERAKNTLSNPNAVLSQTLINTLYQQHPRVQNVPKPEDYEHINIDRAATIYQERFGSAKDFVFIIVGSFDIDKIKPLIATYIGSLPTNDIVTNYKDLGIHPVNGVVKKEVFSGSEQKSQVNLIFTGNTEYSRAERNRFSAMIDVLNIKITDVLREKLTLIYSGGINGAFERTPDTHYRIGISLPCKPENVEQVATAMLAEIEKIKQNGPEQADLDKVKQNWRKQYQIDMRTNQYWLGNLQDAALYHTNPEEILEAEKRIEALDQAGIQAAAKKYFNTQNYVQVVLYPEKK